MVSRCSAMTGSVVRTVAADSAESTCPPSCRAETRPDNWYFKCILNPPRSRPHPGSTWPSSTHRFQYEQPRKKGRRTHERGANSHLSAHGPAPARGSRSVGMITEEGNDQLCHLRVRYTGLRSRHHSWSPSNGDSCNSTKVSRTGASTREATVTASNEA